MTFEICTDAYLQASFLKKHNIKRVELCSALSIGGLTPSIPMAKMFTDHVEFETHVMIRPREGDFCYSELEIDLMQHEIHLLAKQGIKGIVLGCLTNQRNVDSTKTEKLVTLAKTHNLEVTFHRAFDHVLSPFDALDILIDLKVDRLLTSGLKDKAINGIELIKELVIKSDKRIQIMAGSGIDENNAKRLAATGVDALHFSSHKTVANSDFNMGNKKILDENKIVSIVNIFR